MAIKADLADILETILSVPPPHLDLSVCLNDFFTVGQLAVMKNTDSQETLRCLQLLSADPRVDWNVRNYNGDTPLLDCLKQNKTDLALTLLNNPAVDLDTVDRDGNHLESLAR